LLGYADIASLKYTEESNAIAFQRFAGEKNKVQFRLAATA
jgi:hypothetical protein